jgi:DNA-binding NtrC family response regulator
MAEKISALLVQSEPDPMRGLQRILDGLCVETIRARDCREASDYLSSENPPQLVLTDPQMPDGTWKDMLQLASVAKAPVNIIVVSRNVDMHFYLEAIEQGAFDFIAPPFEAVELEHVVRCAAENVRRRRMATALLQKAGAHSTDLFPAVA